MDQARLWPSRCMQVHGKPLPPCAGDRAISEWLGTLACRVGQAPVSRLHRLAQQVSLCLVRLQNTAEGP